MAGDIPPTRPAAGPANQDKKKEIASSGGEDDETTEKTECDLPPFAKSLSDSSVIFTLLVGSKKTQIIAHSDILSKLDFFRAICEGNFKESKERLIRLPEDDPYAIGILIEYLYTDRWESFMATPTRKAVPAECTDQDSEKIRTYGRRLIELAVVAKKYGCEKLEKDVYLKFQAYFGRTGLLWADLLHVWQDIYKYTDGNCEGLRLRYLTSQTKVQWEENGRLLADHKLWFNGLRAVVGDEALEEVFLEYPDFAFDVFTVLTHP